MMMQHPLPRLLAVLGAAALVLTGCGAVSEPSGPTVTEDRNVDASTTAVRLDGTGDLTVRTGEPSLTITARESTMSRLTSEVVDGVLVLGVRSQPFLGNLGPIEYELVLPEVDGLAALGTGDIEASLEPADGLQVFVDGTGGVRADGVDVEELVVEIDGTGNVELSGTADAQSVRVDGTGSYHGAELESVDAVVVVDGTGDADVQVSRALDAQVDGIGSVTHGGGAEVSADVDGLGDVRER